MTDVGAADRALDAVAVAVAANLAASGWRRRRLGIWWLDTYTRELAGGVLGTVEVQRLVRAFGDEWPTDVRVHLGVGYESALGLMPLVALAPVATLVNDDAASRVVTLHDDGEVAQSAREIAAFVDEHAATVAAQFPPVPGTEVSSNTRIATIAYPAGSESDLPVTILRPVGLLNSGKIGRTHEAGLTSYDPRAVMNAKRGGLTDA